MSDEEGYGYEWDAMLIGGPADGCLDRVISINFDDPPRSTIRIVDGNTMNRETLGEKLIEMLTREEVEGSQRVAVYNLRFVDENQKCTYDYCCTVTMDEYRSSQR